MRRKIQSNGVGLFLGGVGSWRIGRIQKFMFAWVVTDHPRLPSRLACLSTWHKTYQKQRYVLCMSVRKEVYQIPSVIYGTRFQLGTREARRRVRIIHCNTHRRMDLMQAKQSCHPPIQMPSVGVRYTLITTGSTWQTHKSLRDGQPILYTQMKKFLKIFLTRYWQDLPIIMVA